MFYTFSQYEKFSLFQLRLQTSHLYWTPPDQCVFQTHGAGNAFARFFVISWGLSIKVRQAFELLFFSLVRLSK